jgi:VanZ family protein
MKKFNIILLIIWLITIFMFSNDKAQVSSAKSDGISTTICNIIDSNCSESTLDTIIFIVRKTAHFLEYLILGILVINVIKDYKVLELKYLITGVVICMLYSISDELHQLFISGRSCQIRDVLIDTLGSITGIYLYQLIYKRKTK